VTGNNHNLRLREEYLAEECVTVLVAEVNLVPKVSPLAQLAASVFVLSVQGSRLHITSPEDVRGGCTAVLLKVPCDCLVRGLRFLQS
jgi:hypothetical protein